MAEDFFLFRGDRVKVLSTHTHSYEEYDVIDIRIDTKVDKYPFAVHLRKNGGITVIIHFNRDGTSWPVANGSVFYVHKIEGPKDEEPKTEEFSQDPSPYRFDLIPAKAMLRIAEIIAYGDKKHGRYNWKKIPADVHHGRSEAHMLKARIGDTSEDNYGHAAVRAIFALSQAIDEGKA